MTEMMETKKLYDQDAYATEFEATVLSCQEIEKDGKALYQVVLDQTLFFPEEGGQSPDQGTLGGVNVVDVQIKKDIITHTLDQSLNPGETVKGKLDWQHRFYNMQQHSGEHIFSGLVHKRFGFDNVGFHLSNQIVTMDFNGVISPKDLEDIEYAVNEAIAKNIEIEVTFPAKEELAAMEYRSKIEIDGQVRIVTVLGYDVCACCAPHVKRTGEIGMLKIMSVQNYKGGVRVSILCGFRALMAFREKAQIIADLTGALTCGQENLVDNMEKMKANNQTLKNQLTSAKQELMNYKLTAIDPNQKDVLIFERGLDNGVLRGTVNALVEKHPGICGVFNGDDTNGYNYVIGSKSVDCKEIAGILREKFGAKGGGSNQMIQGSLSASQAEIEGALV